jgi:hypothetical protein
VNKDVGRMQKAKQEKVRKIKHGGERPNGGKPKARKEEQTTKQTRGGSVGGARGKEEVRI